MTQTDDIKMVVTHDRQERQPITAVWRNGGFSASYDSFVVKQTVVLRINICGVNPPLRQATTVMHKFKKTATMKNITTTFLLLLITLFKVNGQTTITDLNGFRIGQYRETPTNEF